MAKILIKRGKKASLPVLDNAELGLCTDTEEVFIGNNSSNLQFLLLKDIINNLTSGGTTKVLSAEQGKTLKGLIDSLTSKVNGKANTTVASQTVNGLMAAADKKKLDGIATGANKYTHPSTHPASIISQDSTHRFVTDAEKTKWNNAGAVTSSTTSINITNKNIELNYVYANKITVQGDLVVINMGIVAASTADTPLYGGLILFTLPTNARPKSRMAAAVYGINKTAQQTICSVYIDSTGTVSLDTDSELTGVYGSIVFTKN